MNRRQALKNLGLGGGALVATPAIISLLQSCGTGSGYTPAFLSAAEAKGLKSMVDLIIPSDLEVPGGVDVGVHQFIDLYWAEVLPSDEQIPALEDEFTKYSASARQSEIRKGFAALARVLERDHQTDFDSASSETYDALLGHYLKADKAQADQWSKELWEYRGALETDPQATVSDDVMASALIQEVRGMTIWTWTQTQEIGENVLWYDPVPGVYQGCLPTSEAGNGKVMSL
jgi:hypothetical protein